MGKKLFVGNLAFSTTGADLEALFASAGTVESATVVSDRDSGRSRGFGFVEMSSSTEAAKAIQELELQHRHHPRRRLGIQDALEGVHDIGGRQINVSEAKERESRGGGGRFGGRR